MKPPEAKNCLSISIPSPAYKSEPRTHYWLEGKLVRVPRAWNVKPCWTATTKGLYPNSPIVIQLAPHEASRGGEMCPYRQRRYVVLPGPPINLLKQPWPCRGFGP